MQGFGKSSRSSRRRPNRRPSNGQTQPIPLQRPGQAVDPESSLRPVHNSDSLYDPGLQGQHRRQPELPPASKGTSSNEKAAHRQSPRASYSDSSRLNLRNLLTDPGAANRSRDTQRDGGGRSPRPTLYSVENPADRGRSPVSRGLSRTNEFLPPTAEPRLGQRQATASPAPKRLRRTRRAAKPPSPMLYLTRLLILGVGIGAIAGTFLSVWNPTARTQVATASATVENPKDLAAKGFRLDGVPGTISLMPIATRLGQPIAPLAASIQSLIAQYPELGVGVFVVDLDTGNYVDINGATVFPAASTIKAPVLVAFLQDVDAGKIRLDDQLTLRPGDITDGSGELQYQEPGVQINALETANQMITISDNTATNMVIAKVGGLPLLNQRFRAWGLSHTVLNNLLADIAGTNTTSAKDLSMLMMAVTQGDFLSLRSRDRFLEIMRGTVNDNLLPAGLGAGAVIAHKTGNLATLTGDTGIVDMPNGRRYVITAIVKRANESDEGPFLIQQISQTVYEHFARPRTANPSVTSPSSVTAPGVPQTTTPP